jgi:tetratricopeptide (TPR) repeat protein
MKCPICDFEAEDSLRCPNCQKPLTAWKNFDIFARETFEAGLYAARGGDPNSAIEHFLRAALFSPNTAEYWSCYGRALAQIGRYEQASAALGRAQTLDPQAETIAALAKVEELYSIEKRRCPDVPPEVVQLQGDAMNASSEDPSDGGNAAANGESCQSPSGPDVSQGEIPANDINSG